MVKKKHKDKKIQKKIAKNRINKLFIMAQHCAITGKIKTANRYIEIARNISMKYLVTIPKPFKRSFCKHCYSYLLPNITCRIRIHNSKIIIYCYNCKKFTRFPLKK